MKPSHRRRVQRFSLWSSQTTDGFSLVEVTIAMGIVATVLISLLALLPYGMENVREAKSTLVQSRIANEIVGELQVADWGTEPTYSRLAKYDDSIRLYDAEGTLLADTTKQKTSDAIYKAKIEVPATENSHLPGQAGSTQGKYLRKVVVKVAYAPGDKKIDFDAKKLPLPYKSFTTEVVKMARDKL